MRREGSRGGPGENREISGETGVYCAGRAWTLRFSNLETVYPERSGRKYKSKARQAYEWGGRKHYAPEQTAGKLSLGRMNGDVFSVGAHLLELISGLEPTPENMGKALAKVPERVATIDGQSTTLRQVIERALDPDPATRLQNAKQMLHLLEPFASMP